MKKILSIILTVAMILTFAACGSNEAASQQEYITLSKVSDVDVPEFSVSICGAEITNEDMASYSLYSAVSKTVNSEGNASENTYVGYRMSDVLDVAQIGSGDGPAEIICTDGYESKYEGSLFEDGVLLAITKNGEGFKEAPWFAPCPSDVTGDFAKNVAAINLEGVTSPVASAEADSEDSEDEPEIQFPQDPVSEDKTDKIEFADFSFKINGNEVTNADLEGLSIFRNTVVTKNSKDIVSESKYSGYVLKDVLAKLGISGTKVTAIASDGYEAELAPELIDNDLTIIAIEKDKQTGEDGTVWLAPCSENKSGAYAKGVVEITVE